MNISTHGIVLRKVKYGESSLIVDLYTEATGKQTYIVHGVRSSRAKNKANLFNIGNMLQLECYHQPHNRIQKLRDYSLKHYYSSIPFNFVRGNIAVFMCELISKSVKEQEANGPLCEFLESILLFLDQYPQTPSNLPLFFALRLTHFLGFGISDSYDEDVPYFDLRYGQFIPDSLSSKFCLDHPYSEYISILNDLELENCERLPINNRARRQLLRYILQYYKWHVEGMGEIYSHRVLEDVFS